MWSRSLSLALCGLVAGCAHGGKLAPEKALTSEERWDAIRRASVWSPRDVASADIRKGPPSKEHFAWNQWVDCEYREKKFSGHSAKLGCDIEPGHTLKVKYGEDNGEVIGEALGTRLLWALGFTADRMYPVRVRCRGCPKDPWNHKQVTAEVEEFDPAVIELRAPGREMESSPKSGWTWSELALVGPDSDPSERAHRDGLKLLAAFVQHTDSKAANQRLLCPPGEEAGEKDCRHPVLMVSDLGLTFGRANLLSRNRYAGVNFALWSTTPVWKNAEKCEADLAFSATGTLHNPQISEAGRKFLADLLLQLSDAQIRELFETARVELRPRNPAKGGEPASVEEWVAAFKRKRDEIVNNHCPQ
jgi:hypothetical protein